MTKKTWLQVAVLAVLASVYVFGFSGWFQPKKITIYTFTSRKDTSTAIGRQNINPARGRQAQPVVARSPLNFVLSFPLKLTMIKVVPLDEYQTNRHALPVWHVVSSSNTPPVKIFSYGQDLRSMKPFVSGTHPQPLATNVTYRMFFQAGDVSGEHDFQLK